MLFILKASVFNFIKDSVYFSFSKTNFFAVLFSGKEFQGQKIKVSMARRKPGMAGMRGGMPMRGGPGMDRGGIFLEISKKYFVIVIQPFTTLCIRCHRAVMEYKGSIKNFFRLKFSKSKFI